MKDKIAALVTAARRCAASGDVANAATNYNRALAISMRDPALLLEVATFAEKAGSIDSAIQVYSALGRLSPSCGYEVKLGELYAARKEYQVAAEWFTRAVKAFPDAAGVRRNAAACMALSGLEAEALAFYREEYARFPSAESLKELLSHQIRARDLSGADASCRDAVEKFRSDLQLMTVAGEHLLASGRYGEGFDLLSGRWSGKPMEGLFNDLPCAWWSGPGDGENLVVVCEQGLGDVLLVSSLFGDLISQGASLHVLCYPRLIPLFRRSFPSVLLYDSYDQVAAIVTKKSAAFRKVLGIDIFRHLRRDAREVRPMSGWLCVDEDRVRDIRRILRERFGNAELIGISWRSSRHFNGQDIKSMGIEELQSIFPSEGKAWISLQYGDHARDVARANATGFRVHTLEGLDVTNDMDGLAALLSCMDRVVSVSNTTVHLAAAVGARTDLFLPRGDGVAWYWGYSGDSCVWYKTVKIHRRVGQSFTGLDV